MDAGQVFSFLQGRQQLLPLQRQHPTRPQDYTPIQNTPNPTASSTANAMGPLHSASLALPFHQSQSNSAHAAGVVHSDPMNEIMFASHTGNNDQRSIFDEVSQPQQRTHSTTQSEQEQLEQYLLQQIQQRDREKQYQERHNQQRDGGS